MQKRIMLKMDIKKLIKLAMEAREYSYSPYSDFKVGSAVLTDSGQIYTGCNIESASYSPTICAERVAISKAISEGNRDIRLVVIVGSSDLTFPCGVCRQFIREFGKDIDIVVANSEEDYKIFKLEELFPNSFGPDDLKEMEDKNDI